MAGSDGELVVSYDTRAVSKSGDGVRGADEEDASLNDR
jgi:hypothetical protein